MKKALPVLSLRVLLMSLVGLLVATALVFAVRDLQQSMATYRHAMRLAERNHVADNSLQAVKNFAFERGRSNVVLRGRNPVSEENRRFIDERREAADRHIGEVLARLPDDVPGKGDEVRRAWEQVRGLRPTLDRDFSRQLAERDPALPDRWLSAANELVAKLEVLLIEVSYSPWNTDAVFERLSSQRVFALQFRNMVGSESTTLAAELTAGRTPSQEVIDSVSVLRGRAKQLWSQLELVAERLGNPVIFAALGKAHTELFGRLRPLQDDILHATETDVPASARIDSYLAASVAALDSTVELTDGINRMLADYTTNLLAEARRQEIISLGSIAAILILAGLVVLVLGRRFTRPLNGIMARIHALTCAPSGLSAVAVPMAGGDEFASVQQALSLLEKTENELIRSAGDLDKKNNLLNTLLEPIPVGIHMVEVPSGKLLIANQALTHLWGRAGIPDLRMQGSSEAFSVLRLPDRVPYPFDERPLVQGMQGKSSHVEDMLIVFPDGEERVLEIMGAPVRDGEGRVWASVASVIDITERSRAAAEMSHLAFHDPLTHLPNRRLFYDRIRMAISQARREKSRLAVMQIDLDKFKPVNDNLGHEVGDLLLKDAAERMQACLRESDTLARVGGDEFAVILPGTDDELDALVVAEKIRLALNEPFDLAGGYRISIACCIGVAVFPEHGKDETQLLKNADDAMYLAKELGRNGVRLCRTASGSRAGGAAEVPDLSIVRLIWHESYNCGETSIDREHRMLFDRANALVHDILSGEGASERVFVAIDDLIDLAKRHFEDEEKILARYGYADLEEHRLKHQELARRALALRDRAVAGELPPGDLLVFLAQEVIANHMLREDRKFFPLLRIRS